MLKTFFILYFSFIYVSSCCITFCNKDDLNIKICGDNIDININNVNCNDIYKIIGKEYSFPEIKTEIKLNNTLNINNTLNTTNNFEENIISSKNKTTFVNTNYSKPFLNPSPVSFPSPSFIISPSPMSFPSPSPLKKYTPSPNYIRGTQNEIDKKIENELIINDFKINKTNITNNETDLDIIPINKNIDNSSNLYYLFFLLIIPLFIVIYIFIKNRKNSVLPIIHLDSKDYISSGKMSPISAKTIRISVKDYLRPRDMLIQKMKESMEEENYKNSIIKEEVEEVIEFLIKKIENSNT